MLKPSAVERGLLGEIISRFERKGLRIIAMKMIRMRREEAERLYEVHRGKHFYEQLVSTIAGKRVVVMVLEGRSAISVVRKMVGATDPVNAEPGTIRGDLGLDITDNLVHASDGKESTSTSTGSSSKSRSSPVERLHVNYPFYAKFISDSINIYTSGPAGTVRRKGGEGSGCNGG
jgi:nucleoside diphosphate kinase (EC 2.7.4.6)